MRKRSRPSAGFVIMTAAAATAVAVLIQFNCAVEGFDLIEGTAVGGSSSTTTGSAGDGGNAGSGGGSCGVLPPQPPPQSDPGPDDVEFVAALHSVDLGVDFDALAGPSVGYDLDSMCTCQGEQASCAPAGSASCENDTDPCCDGPGGRDNGFARLLQAMEFAVGAVSSDDFSDDAHNGNWSLLLWISGYNGQPNDTEIHVAVLASGGFDQDPCNPPAPLWDGSDHWPVDPAAVDPGGGSGGCGSGLTYSFSDANFTSTTGYVTNSVMVANLPDSKLVLPSLLEGGELKLVAGYATGRLEKQGQGWYIRDGVLTGRWKMDDFFDNLSTITSSGQPICQDHFAYKMLKDGLCNFADIHGSVQPPGQKCDALSLGLGFTADPARLGIRALDSGGGGSGGGCAPGQDPADDTCD